MKSELTSSLAGWLMVWVVLAAIIFSWLPEWGQQQFSYLARSFWMGRVDFVGRPGSWEDVAVYAGKYYWALGPLPAVVVMPMVWVEDQVGVFLGHRWVQPVVVVGVMALAYMMARKAGWGREGARYLTLAFMGGSVMLGVAFWPWGWEWSQLVATGLVLAAIWEYMGRRRWEWLGMWAGLLVLTRVTAALGVGVFVGVRLWQLRERWWGWVKFGVPVGVAVGILAGYNYLRFGQVGEQGYRYQNVPVRLETARNYGLLSWVHIPGNLYYMLVAGPEPVLADGVSRVLKPPYVRANLWGMGIVVTSPYLLKLLWLKYKKREVMAAGAAVVMVAGVLAMYYGVGWKQFGYRYSLDFLPWLHYVLLTNWGEEKRVGRGYGWLILGSVLVNFYLFVTIFL